MNSKIQQSLRSHFIEHRFVFWHDIDAAYRDELAAFAGVQIVDLDVEPALAIKQAVDQASPASQWLFYSQQPEPAPEDDWLLDVRLRGKTFHADVVSMQLEELGLQNLSLRGHLKERSSFLAAKDRFDRLKRLVLATDSAADLDRKMMAVLLRAEQPDLPGMLLKLFFAMNTDTGVDWQVQAKGWSELENYGLLPSFWALVEREYGYVDDKPSLRDLLFHMLVTDLDLGLLGNLPPALQHFRLNERAKAASVAVFLNQWRTNVTHYTSYDQLSAAASAALQLQNHMAALPAEQMLDAMTFAEVEKWIIRDLRDRILSGAASSLEAVQAVFERRRDGHWANPKLAASSDETRGLLCCYEALQAAAAFLSLCEQHEAGFAFADARQGMLAYQQELFRFDQFYRQFHRAAEQVDLLGWQLLQSLRSKVEDAYTGWFVPQLGVAWSKLLEGDTGLLQSWRVPGVLNQQQFFRREVQSLLENSTVKRVFVIISDALRFEAAEELGRQLLQRNKYKTTLDAMLGVLPSYTTLGMAALLPHDSLAYKDNGQVQVDSKPAASLDDRHAVLAKHGGMAIHWEELVSLGKEKARERVRDASVVYIYHDRIDMLGDTQKSERQTFEAVADTLDELNRLVGFVVGNLAASTVLITADHGFLYQESALDAADRSTLDVKDSDTIKAKKRYVLGRALGDTPKAWCGNTAVTAGTQADASLDFWVPKGAARFHFSGGARFVHGSAMPQEVIVPLLTVKVSEASSAKVEKVKVSALMVSNKVVTNLQKFEFIQADPVSAKCLPLTVSISLRDGEQAISNEQIVTFDSTAATLDERRKHVMLTLQAGQYDTGKDYYLVLRDVDLKVEVMRHPVRIDLAFSNDF